MKRKKSASPCSSPIDVASSENEQEPSEPLTQSKTSSQGSNDKEYAPSDDDESSIKTPPPKKKNKISSPKTPKRGKANSGSAQSSPKGKMMTPKSKAAKIDSKDTSNASPSGIGKSGTARPWSIAEEAVYWRMLLAPDGKTWNPDVSVLVAELDKVAEAEGYADRRTPGSARVHWQNMRTKLLKSLGLDSQICPECSKKK